MASDWTLVATALIGAAATVTAVWLTQRSARKSAERVSGDTRAAAERAADDTRAAAERAADLAREQRAEERGHAFTDERRAAAARFLAALHTLKTQQTTGPPTEEAQRRAGDAYAEVTLLFPQQIQGFAFDTLTIDPHEITGDDNPNRYDVAVDALVAAMKADLGIE